MFHGVIRTRDILLNPRTIISMHGFKGFICLLFKAISRKPYHFVNSIHIEVTQKIFIGKQRRA